MSRTADRFREQFNRGGRRVTLERTVPDAAPLQVANVRARLRGYAEEEVGGGVKSGERRVLILAEDVPESFRPLRQGDKVILDGLTLRFLSRPDDQTYRDGETLLAIDGVAAGA